MKTLLAALLAVALTTLALAATAASKLSAGFSRYQQFKWLSYCPWKAEFLLSALELSKEKVIQINKSTQRALLKNKKAPFEIKNPIVSHLENPLLGDNCYVGYQEPINNGELPATTIGNKKAGPNSSRAGVEKSNQTEAFHELSQLKTHLA
jgi:hypothetical protein